MGKSTCLDVRRLNRLAISLSVLLVCSRPRPDKPQRTRRSEAHHVARALWRVGAELPELGAVAHVNNNVQAVACHADRLLLLQIRM